MSFVEVGYTMSAWAVVMFSSTVAVFARLCGHRRLAYAALMTAAVYCALGLVVFKTLGRSMIS